MADKFPVNKIPNYWSLGFLSLQYAVDSVFLKVRGNELSDLPFSKLPFSLSNNFRNLKNLKGMMTHKSLANTRKPTSIICKRISIV